MPSLMKRATIVLVTTVPAISLLGSGTVLVRITMDSAKAIHNLEQFTQETVSRDRNLPNFALFGAISCVVLSALLLVIAGFMVAYPYCGIRRRKKRKGKRRHPNINRARVKDMYGLGPVPLHPRQIYNHREQPYHRQTFSDQRIYQPNQNEPVNQGGTYDIMLHDDDGRSNLKKTTGDGPTSTTGYMPTDSTGLSPTNTPGYMPTNTPGYMPTNTPGYMPTNTPGYMPTNTPGYMPTNTPGYIPTNTPGNMPTNSTEYTHENRIPHHKGKHDHGRDHRHKYHEGNKEVTSFLNQYYRKKHNRKRKRDKQNKKWKHSSYLLMIPKSYFNHLKTSVMLN